MHRTGDGIDAARLEAPEELPVPFIGLGGELIG